MTSKKFYSAPTTKVHQLNIESVCAAYSMDGNTNAEKQWSREGDFVEEDETDWEE